MPASPAVSEAAVATAPGTAAEPGTLAAPGTAAEPGNLAAAGTLTVAGHAAPVSGGADWMLVAGRLPVVATMAAVRDGKCFKGRRVCLFQSRDLFHSLLCLHTSHADTPGFPLQHPRCSAISQYDFHTVMNL